MAGSPRSTSPPGSSPPPALHALLSSLTAHTFRYARTAMTTLTIRNVDAALKERLRIRAARNGRSMKPNCARF
jgi:hypothetical protein